MVAIEGQPRLTSPPSPELREGCGGTRGWLISSFQSQTEFKLTPTTGCRIVEVPTRAPGRQQEQNRRYVRASSESAVSRPPKRSVRARSTVRRAAEAFHGKAPTLVRAEPNRVAPVSLAQSRCSATPASDPSPTGPVLRANPCPEVTDRTCRLPLPTLFYRLEAVHLGDLLRIWVRTGTKITLSPSDLQGPTEAHRTPQEPRCFYGNSVPISGRADSRDTNPYKEKTTLPRVLRRRLRVRLRYRT
ncbi:uncharacterized protein LOC129975713 [Argiope bruennichi]|uniref:uncharacterized protein LOC129975713 n=1 Tax=Argiope bruennichi TaxID=94029 RepID=UPI002493FA63|nr:uncharacterized protein LOC129975713 [Argiope bruennichi]